MRIALKNILIAGLFILNIIIVGFFCSLAFGTSDSARIKNNPQTVGLDYVVYAAKHNNNLLAGRLPISEEATSTQEVIEDESQQRPVSSSTPIATINLPPPSNKLIDVNLSTQQLVYYESGQEIGSFAISSGIWGMPTPKGEYYVQIKRPVVLYKGPGYYFPNTKWNLQFLPHYYIHGAYWHNNFGHRMSHGCVNVSYVNMEGLYNWADVGTRIIIHD